MSTRQLHEALMKEFRKYFEENQDNDDEENKDNDDENE